MAYVTAEARQELLDTVAEATDELGVALSERIRSRSSRSARPAARRWRPEGARGASVRV